MDPIDYQPLTIPADPRGGMKSNPDFQINANMDGPRLRDGNSGRLSDPYRPMNGDC